MVLGKATVKLSYIYFPVIKMGLYLEPGRHVTFESRHSNAINRFCLRNAQTRGSVSMETFISNTSSAQYKINKNAIFTSKLLSHCLQRPLSP